jgi:anaerobic magnesium-protoporphyrin IX monomethyl ester cyclase
MERQGQKPPVFWSNIMLGIPGETHEDAIKTMRMVKYTQRILPSISFYAPYPGSALGHQLIAEGKSLMTKENYHRFPDDEKVKGIDYAFYRELLAGQYDDEVNRGLAQIRQERKDYRAALTKA